MKKLFFLMTAVLIAAVGFAQYGNVKTQQKLRKDDFTNGVVRTVVQHNTTVSKDMMSALAEDFETALALPAGWSTSADNSWEVIDTVGLPNLTNHTTGAAGNVAMFDCYLTAAAGEGTISTPSLAVTAGDASCSFWINYYLIGGAYGSVAELYVGVSNDNGATWTESATNLIVGQEGAGWFQHTMDLTAFETMDYTDDVVIVRLRAVSDYGSYNIALDDFAGPEIYVPANPDLQVMGMLDAGYTMLPLDQMMEIMPAASVTNVGFELTAATDVDFAVTGEAYTESVALTVPMATGVVEDVMATTGFTPAAVGTFEFTMEATVADDDNAADNVDAVSFTVTDDEMAYDNEDIVGQLGAGTGALMGNKFVFNADGGLAGAKFYITDNITDGYDCTVKVIDFTGGVVGSVLVESATIAVAGATNAWYTAEFELAVTAGQEVLIVVDNLAAAVFMALARDANYVENVTYASTDGIAFDEIGGLGFPNAFLVRAITGEPATCATPSALTATDATTTSVMLGWTSDGDLWNIEYGMAGFTMGEGTTMSGVTDNPYSLTGLDAATEYAFYVQSDCGADGTSNWAGPFGFSTECAVSTSLMEGFETAVPPICWATFQNGAGANVWAQAETPQEGTYNAIAGWENSGAENQQWLVTGQITMPANNKLVFYAKDQFTSPYASVLKVLVSADADGMNTAAYTELLSIDEDDTGEYRMFEIDMTAYAGQDVFIAFEMIDNDGDNWHLDNVVLTEITGLENNITEAMNVYPNPTSGMVNVSNVNGASISVINMLGQEVYSTVAVNDILTIDASVWEQGTYMVRIVYNDEVKVMKFNLVK